MELYRKHRPNTLDEIVGNGQIVESLRAMAEKGNIPHAVLFSGESGCGKTTFARIIKNMVGCSDMDYREIDAVAMSGIDMVRDLREEVNLMPMAGKAKVYLLDECHRLGGTGNSAASDCLLKALEECPDFVYFILATTNPEKLSKTLRNRCVEMVVSPLSVEQIAKKLLYPICKKEGKEVPKNVLVRIAEVSAGSCRRALTALQSIIDMPVERMKDADLVIMSEDSQVIELCRLLVKGAPFKKCAEILRTIKEDPESVRRIVLGYLNSVLLNTGSVKVAEQIVAFEKNYYDTGKAGLTLSVFSACLQE
jgi:DNA polymerase III subunit gamma/tau